jgi:hypothetical protein
MATTPAQPNLVIPDDYYEKSRIDFEEFKERTSRIATLVIDIMDICNREIEPRLKGVRNIPMESFLEAVNQSVAEFAAMFKIFETREQAISG